MSIFKPHTHMPIPRTYPHYPWNLTRSHRVNTFVSHKVLIPDTIPSGCMRRHYISLNHLKSFDFQNISLVFSNSLALSHSCNIYNPSEVLTQTCMSSNIFNLFTHLINLCLTALLVYLSEFKGIFLKTLFSMNILTSK